MHTRQSLLTELQKLAEERGPDVTAFEFRVATGISPYYVEYHWGNWTRLRLAAGLPVRPCVGPVYSDEELLTELNRTACQLNDFPTSTQFDRLSNRSWHTLERRFGDRQTVLERYRDWTGSRTRDETPSFLADCPAGCVPSTVPGIYLVKSPLLNVLAWLLLSLGLLHASPWLSGGPTRDRLPDTEAFEGVDCHPDGPWGISDTDRSVHFDASAPRSPAAMLSRREFIQASLAAGTAVAAGSPFRNPLVQAAEARSANEKLNIAVVGVAARGGANLAGVAHENIAVLCDIDQNRLSEAASKFPSAKTLVDFREIFELPGIDGIVVSTPDHTHAIPVAMALKKGMPVYCEKPLTHSLYEARVLRRLNAAAKVPTQMGNQIHSDLSNYRRVVEIVRSGQIGEIQRVHVWLGSGTFAGKRVAEGTPPTYVNYDLWLGPAPYRPFHESHFHFNWRYWWDFGNGQLGDFGCHYMDLPFWALELGAPTTITAQGEKAHDGDNECPSKLQVDYHFPARAGAPPVHLTWYHGGGMPEGAEQYQKGSAVLFEGSEGRLLADYGSNKVFLNSGKTAEAVKPWITDSIGHHKEWLRAIRTGESTGSNFEYATNLTEAVHLGNIAYRVGKPITFDAAALKCVDCPEADPIIRREYRDGWTLPT